MSKLISTELLDDKARIVDAPSPAVEVDRTFELPRRLYGATVALYLGFLGIMAAGLSSEGLIIPMAIFVLFVIAGFGVPALWTRLNPCLLYTSPSPRDS